MSAVSAPKELPPIATSATPGQVLVSLGGVWTKKFGAIRDAAPLLLLLAQWALETGRGKDCVCWNLGNVKSVEGDGRSFTYFSCTEIFPLDFAQETEKSSRTASIVWTDEEKGIAEVRFLPRDPATRFRAFLDLDTGAADWLDEEAEAFKGAWAALLLGDPNAFAQALSKEHYMTAPVEQYAHGLAGLFAEFSNLSPDGRHFDLQTPAGLQGALGRLGFYAGKDDSKIGPMTQSAILRFQKSAGVEVDGVVGKDTRAALAKALLAAGPVP